MLIIFLQNSQLLGGTLWRSLTANSNQNGHKNSYKFLSKRWLHLKKILRNIRIFDEAYREFHVRLRNLLLADTKADRLTAESGLHIRLSFLTSPRRPKIASPVVNFFSLKFALACSCRP